MRTAVVLDVVASRTHADQRRLLAGVEARVRQVLVEQGAATSAAATTGDELQALYAADATGAAVRDLVRLRLLLRVAPPGDRAVDVRAGIGVGEVVADAPDDAGAPGQSGSAWWHARDALQEAGRRRNGWPDRRMWLATDRPDAHVWNTALLGLDVLLAGLDETDAVAALGLLDGSTAAQVAADLRLAPSSLSERLHRHGVYGVVRAVDVLAGP